MKVNIKLDHHLAQMPEKAHPSDAGFDLVAVDYGKSYDHDYIEYDTGICLEIPEGYVGLLFPRSSLSKYDLTLCNSVGVVDSSYRGRVKLRFKKTSNTKPDWNQDTYKRGDKIGQLVILPIPQIEFVIKETLTESERGTDGFGSSGN